MGGMRKLRKISVVMVFNNFGFQIGIEYRGEKRDGK